MSYKPFYARSPNPSPIAPLPSMSDGELDGFRKQEKSTATIQLSPALLARALHNRRTASRFPTRQIKSPTQNSPTSFPRPCHS